MTMSVRRVILVLAATAFVEWVGATAILPLLPAYLRHQGTSTAMVGLVMSAYFAAGLLLQYPVGRLGDRIGQRPVLIGGLLTYALGSLGFLLHPGALVYIALRGAQGAGAGAVQVASFALVGAVVPSERRGRAFSLLFAGQLSGAAIGPLAGSIAGISGMSVLFIATAATSTLASVWVLASLPRIAPTRDALRTRLVLNRLLLGVVVTGIIGGLITGVYETCWTLLLDLRGAHAWQVGLSWTLFAAPFAAFSPIAGHMADRFDRGVLTIVALASSVAFASLYPFLHWLPLLIGLGTIESIGVAIAEPAAQSLLAQSVPVGALGRAQGLFNAAQTAAMAASAAASGALFAIGPWVPFVTAAASSTALLVALPFVWRGAAESREPVTEARPMSLVV
jgi:DHA1 family multidrug resistance protein-like MFS transporter